MPQSFLGLPFQVWGMMAIEFMERLGYYGSAFMLMTYCTSLLGLSPRVANAIINGFYAAVPISACISSGLADGRFGRPRALMAFTIIYAVGLACIAISSFPFMFVSFPEGPLREVYILFGIGMVLFAFGYGGMKVCTNPMMADSVVAMYGDNEVKRDALLSRLFRWVYWVSNAGALIGMSVAPLLRDVEKRRLVVGSTEFTTGYYYGFSMSAGACVVGVLLFAGMYHWYPVNECAPAFVLVRIIARAVVMRLKFAFGIVCDPDFTRVHRWDLIDYAGYGVDGAARSRRLPGGNGGGVWLNRSIGKGTEMHSGEFRRECESIDREEHDPDSMDSPGWVDDTKATLSVCRMFVALPVYWLIANQYSTNMVLQAVATNLPSSIPPELFNNINTVSLLVSVIIMDRIVVPLFFSDREPSVCGRVGTGFGLMVFSMIWCGVLQIFIDRRGDYASDESYVLHEGETQISALWLILPYIIQGIASALVDTTVMEVAYTMAPIRMKGTVMALYLFASSMSGFLGLALSPVMTPSNAMIVFFSLGCALMFVAILFVWMNKDVRQMTAAADLVVEDSDWRIIDLSGRNGTMTSPMQREGDRLLMSEPEMYGH